MNLVLNGSSLEHEGDESEGKRDANTDEFVQDVLGVVSSALDPDSFVALEQVKLVSSRNVKDLACHTCSHVLQLSDIVRGLTL